jgi:hypothetical protein
MKKQTFHVAMCEPLESRQLLSASLATIKGDVNALIADGVVLKAAAKAFATDLLVKIPIGTPGRGTFYTDVHTYKVDSASAGTTLTNDLAAIKADKNDPTEESAALAQLNSDVTAIDAQLKADGNAINDVLTKHPTLVSDYGKLQKDEAAVVAAHTAFKAEAKVLIADLA